MPMAFLKSATAFGPDSKITIAPPGCLDGGWWQVANGSIPIGAGLA